MDSSDPLSSRNIERCCHEHCESRTNTPGVDESTDNKNCSCRSTRVVVKVALVGDAQVGKTTLMVKYVENRFDEDYIQSLGVNFMEKTITIRNADITLSIWDLGGQREFMSMLPMVCNDAVVIFFLFDLSRKSTLLSIKEWYRQARGLNRVSAGHMIVVFPSEASNALRSILCLQRASDANILPLSICLSARVLGQNAHAFLVGTKFDIFLTFPAEEQQAIDKLARKYAKAMKASLVFTSSWHSVNIQKIFKVVLARTFDLPCTVSEIQGVGEPVLLFGDP
jgi:Gtp-binding protein of the ras superfamily involved in termination of M-phase